MRARGSIVLAMSIATTPIAAAPSKATRATAATPSASVSSSVSSSVASSSTASASPRTPREAARAYESALAGAKLAGPAYVGDAGAPYAPEDIRAIVEDARARLAEGRLVDVVSAVLPVVESPRFDLVKKEPEARAALLVLGEALAQQGASAIARTYLRKAASGPAREATARAASRRLTEIALDDEAYDEGIVDLQPIVDASEGSPEIRGELDYLVGRKLEADGDGDGAARAYARIVPLSRFWSSATYRRGLLAVAGGRNDEAEGLFCAVADPRRQDQTAPVFADDHFFAVRDLARLALGRLAHESLRHDDARYYYYLVPQDSQRLAEALYEAATTRYEARDYEGARDLLDELKTLGNGHVYDDEAHVLDAYVDIARCKLDDALKTLDAFLAAQAPLRDRVHALVIGSDDAIALFLERADKHDDTTSRIDRGDVDARIARRLEADPALLYVLRARRRLAAQIGGLSTSVHQLDGLTAAIAPGASSASAVKPAIDPESFGAMHGDHGKSGEATAAIDGIGAEILALERAGAPREKTEPLRKALDDLDARARAIPKATAVDDGNGSPTSDAVTLPALVDRDRLLAGSLRERGKKTLAELDAAALLLARDALVRLDHRATRLLARARLAKIDVVLGRKKGLEVEVDALKQGILPRSAIDSLEAQRYLGDGEEYWPFEGDEWVDEVVGSEQK